MRSSLNHLANRVTPIVLVVPCLAICLACATPLPLEKLQEGMTADAAREEFGRPDLIEIAPGSVDSSWSYVHEEQAWFLTVMSSTFFLPHCLIATAVTMPFGAEHWCSELMPTVEEKPLILHFEAEKLVRWELLPAFSQVAGGTGGTWSHSLHDSQFGSDSIQAQAARHEAMKKAAKRLGEPGLSQTERSQIRRYYKKVKKNPNMSAGRAYRIKRKIKKVGK